MCAMPSRTDPGVYEGESDSSSAVLTRDYRIAKGRTMATNDYLRNAAVLGVIPRPLASSAATLCSAIAAVLMVVGRAHYQNLIWHREGLQISCLIMGF